MGKPTGFLEFPRELPLARHPVDRIRTERGLPTNAEAWEQES